MTKLNDLLIQFIVALQGLKDEEGQGLIEYSLIAALISIAAILIMATVGGDIVGIFTNVSNAL